MSRVKGTDTLFDMVVKMSEGNPGALTFFSEMLSKEDWNTPIPGAFLYILNLDDMGVYGSKAYMLWNDCCDRDLNKVELVLRNHQMGELSTEIILENLTQGYGTPFEGLKTLEELGLQNESSDSKLSGSEIKRD
jgi:hypothetical protein